MQQSHRPVLLVNPQGGQCFYEAIAEHLGLGYLAAILRRHGIEVIIQDATVEHLTFEDLDRIVCVPDWLLVGITTTQQLAQDAMRLGRHAVAMGTAHVVFGGHLATAVPHHLLATKACHTVALGEGEMTLLELVDCLRQGQPWSGLPGLAHLDDGQITAAAARPLISDLDGLPWPARDHLPEVLKQGGVASVAASRGCYGRCSFCSIKAFYGLGRGPAWRGRRPETTMAEIEHLVDRYGVRVINFVDDNFFGPGRAGREQIAALAEMIIRRGLDIRFFISCRADNVDTELFALLRRAGLRIVALGIEAGNEEDLRLYRKDIRPERNATALRILDQLGISVRTGFIMFNPFTTLSRLKANLDFLRQVPLASTSIIYNKRLLVRYSCPIVDKLRENGLLLENEEGLDYRFVDPAADVAFRLADKFEHRFQLGRRIRELADQIVTLSTSREDQVAAPRFVERLSSIQLDALALILDYVSTQRESICRSLNEADEAFLSILSQQTAQKLESLANAVWVRQGQTSGAT